MFPVVQCMCGCGNALMFNSFGDVVFIEAQVSAFDAAKKDFIRDTKRRIRRGDIIHEVLLRKEGVEDLLLKLIGIYYEMNSDEYNYVNDSLLKFSMEDCEGLDLFSLELIPVHSKTKNIRNYFSLKFSRSDVFTLYNKVKHVYEKKYGPVEQDPHKQKKQILLENKVGETVEE